MIVHMFHALFDGPTLLTHVLTCMEDWSCIHTNKSNWSTLGGGGGGLGEAFLSVHPQLISSFRQPQESTDAPMTKVYIYIYLQINMCAFV